MTPAELDALVGVRFPGGTITVAHWENWLLTDCTGREPMPDGLVHPIAAFHVPILGAGTSIAELFRLGGAHAVAGAVGLEGYDWEYLHPLREEVEYRVEGGVVSAERVTDEATGAVADRVAFRIELHDGDRLVTRVTNRWQFRRTDVRLAPLVTDRVPATGAALPTWEMPSVDPARMKTMAALLRDPYPIHWDRTANTGHGLAGRVVNQGPLNLGYVANMLMSWAGPASVRRLTVSFAAPVLDGDRVVAGGRIGSIADGVATCDVWLARGDEHVVSGTAQVVAPSGDGEELTAGR